MDPLELQEVAVHQELQDPVEHLEHQELVVHQEHQGLQGLMGHLINFLIIEQKQTYKQEIQQQNILFGIM